MNEKKSVNRRVATKPSVCSHGHTNFVQPLQDLSSHVFLVHVTPTHACTHTPTHTQAHYRTGLASYTNTQAPKAHPNTQQRTPCTRSPSCPQANLTHTQARNHFCLHTFTHAFTLTHTHTNTHTNTHAHAHTHTHSHTHMLAPTQAHSSTCLHLLTVFSFWPADSSLTLFRWMAVKVMDKPFSSTSKLPYFHETMQLSRPLMLLMVFS